MGAAQDNPCSTPSWQHLGVVVPSVSAVVLYYTILYYAMLYYAITDDI